MGLKIKFKNLGPIESGEINFNDLKVIFLYITDKYVFIFYFNFYRITAS